MSGSNGGGSGGVRGQPGFNPQPFGPGTSAGIMGMPTGGGGGSPFMGSTPTPGGYMTGGSPAMGAGRMGGENMRGPLAQLTQQYGGPAGLQRAMQGNDQLQNAYDILSRPGNSGYGAMVQNMGLHMRPGMQDAPPPAAPGPDPMAAFNAYKAATGATSSSPAGDPGYMAWIMKNPQYWPQAGSVPVGAAAATAGYGSGVTPSSWGGGGSIAAPSPLTLTNPNGY